MVNDAEKSAGKTKPDFFAPYKANFIGLCYYYNFWT